MKKREITNNDLEQLFSKITEQAPLVSEEQVNVLLTNFSATNPGNATTRFLRNHMNTFLLGTAIAIVASVFIWINVDKRVEETVVPDQVQINPPMLISPSDTVEAKQLVSDEGTDEQIAIGDSLAEAPTKQLVPDTVPEPIVVAPAVSEASASLAAIYQHFAQKPQVFSVPSDRDTTITCKEGTTIKIGANSFVSEKTGEEITGNVEISVKEYYKMSDILMARLTTTSGDKILETGGMLHIDAIAGDDKCAVKPGKSVEIGFPHTSRKDGMALFYGERNVNRIDWKLANAGEEETSEEFFVVEDMPEFPGGDLALRRFVRNIIRYPVDAQQNGIQGKVFVRFVVDEEGKVGDAVVVRSVYPSLDREALRVVNSLPKWKPGRQKGKPVRVSYTIPVGFELNDVDPAASKKHFEQKVEGDNFQDVTASDVNRYVFDAAQYGWFNCDRFYSNAGPTVTYSVLIDEASETTVNLVFHRFKGVVPGIIESNRVIFDRVPLGEKVTIVALREVEGRIFLAVKETEITAREETGLDFQPVTMDLLRKEIEKLNQFD